MVAVLLLLALLAGTGGCAAQLLQRQSWTTDDGLPQNSVHALLQTADGFLWLATEGGIARFDGVRFRRYTVADEPGLPSDDVCCLVEAGTTLYAGTAGGVARYTRGRFEAVAGLTGQVFGMATDADGSLFVLQEDGLWRLGASGKPGRQSLPGVVALGPGPAHMVLAATADSLFQWSGAAWQRLRSLPVPAVQVLQDEQGRVWLRAPSTIVALDGASQRQWKLGSDLPGTRLESLSLTNAGTVAGTNRGGYVLSTASMAPAAIAQAEGNTILCALTDREGELWFGTDSGGVSVLRQRSIGTLPGTAGESATSLAQTGDGTVWIGTRDAGLRVVRGGIAATPPASARLASQFVLALAPAQHNGLWVGSPEGLDLVEGDAVRHLTVADGLPDDYVRTLLAEPDGAVWVGTRKGLAMLRSNVVQRVLTRADGLPSDGIGAMLRTDASTLWVGTLDGLAQVDDGVSTTVVRQTFLRGSVVTALAVARDATVWVGTSDGRLFFRSGNGFLAANVPLQHTAIAALLVDPAGRLWIRDATGVVRAGLRLLQQCAAQAACVLSPREFGTADGMPSTDVAGLGRPSALQTANGELLFATRRGIAIMHSQAEAGATPLPPVAIEQVVVDDAAVPFADGLSLRAGQRRISVQYVGLSLAAPLQVRYRYQLVGFDRDWSDPGGGTVAEYTNLPPGNYRLLVQARSAGSTWSPTPAALSIQIAAPFYRRWWFYLSLTALLGAFAYGVYWLRLRRIKHEFDAVLGERNRIAREIHDTLAQDFVAVSLQLEITAQLLRAQKIEPAQQQIDATRALVRDGIRDARESIWALRAETAAGSLPAALQALVAAIPRAHFRVTGAYRAIAPAMQKEVLRIAKEALGNAARHAGSASISLDLIYSEDAVLIRVSDDGAGFDVDEAQGRKGRFGLRGMAERAAGVGAVLSVESIPGSGSTVSLRLPT